MTIKGQVYQINVKPKTEGERGIPKLPVGGAQVSFQGIEVDFNRYRAERCEGDLDKALLLIPFETIQQLNEEKWPVQAGDLGENITTLGIPYGLFQVGDKYLIGNSLEVKISRPCTACSNLEVLPYVGERLKEFVRALTWKDSGEIKNRRGWYASVLTEGEIRTGDLIEKIIK